MTTVYRRGQPINIVQQFWTLDPVTRAATPANPSSVVFTVLAPDATQTVYTFGVDSQVTNPETGTFVCAIGGPLPPGEFKWACVPDANFSPEEGAFTVLDAGINPTDYTGVATPGPCSSWINGDDVAAAGHDLGIGSNTYLLDDAAYVASHLLYELSGRQFPGVCERTVRPCRDSCSCWGSASSGLPFFWTSSWAIGSIWPYQGGWRNECGETCGCGSESYIRLGGYPVREILGVKIDGVALPATGEYRLDDRRNLIRLADLSGPTPVDRHWPACQDRALPDTEPGTFSVRYTWGADVPALGRLAAAQMARELWASLNGNECKLPTRVTRVIRQGIQYEKLVPTADLLRSGTTGIPLVDAFLAAVNPQKAKRRSGVFSPDVQQFGKKVGQ